MKNNKNKPTFFLIKGTVFPFDVLVSISSDDELVSFIENKIGYKLSDKEVECIIDMTGDARTVRLNNCRIIIRLKKAPKTTLGFDLSDLVHEIEHAAYFILTHIGVKHTDESDEVFAYFQAYLLRQCLLHFQK